MLKQVYRKYEQDRQPETLKAASGYLNRLSEARYMRVWTPLGEDVLRVDDSNGASYPVESLSRGTREQVFLSLRLALIEGYASRGVQMPMILDDVLVNFDAERVQRAAEVFKDFAASGHQVLVFTCHEHIRNAFREIDMESRELSKHATKVLDTRSADNLTELEQVAPPIEKPSEMRVVRMAVAETANAAASSPEKRPNRRHRNLTAHRLAPAADDLKGNAVENGGVEYVYYVDDASYLSQSNTTGTV